MNNIEKAMKEAHEFADKAIKDSKKRTTLLSTNIKSALVNFKAHMSQPVIVNRVHLVSLIVVSAVMFILWATSYG